MFFRETDLETFAAETGGASVQVSQSSRMMLRPHVNLDRKPYPSAFEYINPVMTVARLPRVVIKGVHAIPFSLEKAVYVTHRLTHSDYNPLWHAGGWTTKTTGGIDAELGEIARHVTEPAFLLCMGNNNFGHFIWEALARTLMLSSIPEHRDLKILYPDTLPARYLLWLESMGIKKERLVPIPPESAVLADQLYVSTAPFARTARKQLIAHEESLYYMRQSLFSDGAWARKRERLFFSRSDAMNKRCVNEDEVRAVLAPYDMRVLTGSGTPHAAQLDYVRNAELILAPLGAATAVAAFAPADCMVIELTPSPNIFGTFNATVGALLLGQPFARVSGTRVILPDNAMQEAIYWDYVVNAEDIRSIMERHFLNRTRFES